MRRVARWTAAAGLAAALLAGGIAYANWAIPGEVTVRLKTSAMPRGVTPSVAKAGKKAMVSWSAQRIAPNKPMKSYVVTGHSVDDPGRADIVRTVVATGGDAESVTFAATEVAGGSWYWTLIPRYHSWAGAESKRSDRLKFPAAANAKEPDAVSATPAEQAVVAPVPKSTPNATPKPTPSRSEPATSVTPGATSPDPPEETPPPSEEESTDPPPASTE